MKVIVAKTAGFCKGVKAALEVTLDAIQKRRNGESICTFGPLIHNRQVLAMLEKRGVKEENLIDNLSGKKVVIRAHGIPPESRQALHRLGAVLLDATCKRVAKVHAAIKSHARRGFYTVIVGDADHAEVIGLMGYTEGRGVVINRPEQVEELPSDWENVLLVAQTTQNEDVFQEIRELFLKKFPQGKVKNTICDSTHERQNEVRDMCSQVDAMVIVGGSHSGNTIRLAEVARECEIPTYHIETEADLDRGELSRFRRVGVSAGASTPNWIIRNVVKFLESITPDHPEKKYGLKRTLELLAYSNIYVALGTALLPVMASALTGLPGTFAHSVMAACYAFAMHSLNIFLDRNAIQLNDPNRAAFYHERRHLFTWTSIVAVVAALAISLSLGALTFIAMALMVALGILYTVPFFLPALWERLSIYKLKDIPTSKTLFIPIAWACVTVILPDLARIGSSWAPILYAFWTVFLLVLVRTILLDFLAVQGDRLVGKETLVVLVGEAKTIRIASGVLVLLAVSLLLGPMTGLSSSFTYVMLPIVGVYAWYLRLVSHERRAEDPVIETFVELALIGTGIFALLWYSFS